MQVLGIPSHSLGVSYALDQLPGKYWFLGIVHWCGMSKSLPLTVHHLWIWKPSVTFSHVDPWALRRGVFSLLGFLFMVKYHDHKQLWYEMDYFRLRFHTSVHYLRKPRQKAVDRNWWRVPREVMIVALILIAFPVSFWIAPSDTRTGVYCAQQTMPSHINHQSRKHHSFTYMPNLKRHFRNSVSFFPGHSS